MTAIRRFGVAASLTMVALGEGVEFSDGRIAIVWTHRSDKPLAIAPNLRTALADPLSGRDQKNCIVLWEDGPHLTERRMNEDPPPGGAAMPQQNPWTVRREADKIIAAHNRREKRHAKAPKRRK